MSEKTEIKENAKIQLTSVRNQYISAITGMLNEKIVDTGLKLF